ncbi:MAG: MBL fold metallo-hydrolase, partial [Clostridia bacterium]|nr:MBL fold metallo-hydrolase [Clostridia bacterium]
MPRKKKKHSSEKLIASIIFVALAAVIIVAMYFLFPTMRQRAEEADQSARSAANSQVVAKNVTAPMAGDGLLTLHFISVGQADSIFIEFPTGNNMLIDASEKSTADTVISYVSALGVSAIDYVLLTHQDADHAGGMADIFKAFEVKNALRPSVYSTYKSYALPTDFNIGYESSCPSSTATYYNYLKAVYEEPGCAWEAFNKDSDIDFVATSGGTEYRCTLDFLTPTAAVGSIKYKKENNFSPIMILEYGGVKIMLTGDAEKEVEQELIAYYGDD